MAGTRKHESINGSNVIGKDWSIISRLFCPGTKKRNKDNIRNRDSLLKEKALLRLEVKQRLGKGYKLKDSGRVRTLTLYCSFT